MSQRYLKSFLGALFIVITVWWLLYIPYRPERVLTAIPAQAAFVSVHRDLAGRWDDIAHNPLVQTVLHSAGVTAEDIEALESDPAFEKWLAALASDQSVIAYVPQLGVAGDEAWVFASWIGWQSQRFRVLLSLGLVEGFERMKSSSGVSLWHVQSVELNDGLQLAIAMDAEGVLVGCISPNPYDIEHVLDVYEGQMPSVGSTGILTAEAEVNDRGWMNLGSLAPDWRHLPHGVFSYDVQTLDSHGLQGEITLPSLRLRQVPSHPIDLGALENLLGDIPMAVAAVKPSALFALVPPPLGLILQEELSAFSDRDLVGAIMGEDYSGRIMGLKVPALLVAMHTDSEEQAVLAMNTWIDSLNRQLQLGVIPRKETFLGHSIFRLESSTNDRFNDIPAAHRPAFAIVDQWLIGLTDYTVLTKLLEQAESGSADHENVELGAWRRSSRGTSGAAYAWIDIDQAGRVFRQLASIYAVKLSFQGGKSRRELLQQLKMAKAWTHTLEPLAACSVWLVPDGEVTRIRVEVGD